MNTLQIILLILMTVIAITAPICNSIMDTLKDHFDKSIFKDKPSWNPNESWKNKWKNGDESQGEKYPGSSSIFSFLSDKWHLFKSICFNAYQINFVLFGLFCYQFDKIEWYYFLISFVIYKALWMGIFHIFYTYILVKKK